MCARHEHGKNVEMNAIKNNYIQSSEQNVRIKSCAHCAVWNQSDKYYWRLFAGLHLIVFLSLLQTAKSSKFMIWKMDESKIQDQTQDTKIYQL